MVAIIRNGYGNLTSNHGQGYLYIFHKALIQLFTFVGQSRFFNQGMTTSLEEGKL